MAFNKIDWLRNKFIQKYRSINYYLFEKLSMYDIWKRSIFYYEMKKEIFIEKRK
jgi:hypothetical protein